ncbi:integrase, catalytic region, zinc finger, CCHC-type containing protein [Tanacetum coccineum]
MLPRVMTRSAGRTAAESLGGGTGERCMKSAKVESDVESRYGRCGHAAYTDRGTSKDRSGRDDNKRTRTVNAFATTVNPVGKENTGTWPKCTICNYFHAPGGLCRICYNCNRPGHLARDCRSVPRNVNPVNAKNPTVRACYECGSTDHVKPAFPRWNRAQGLGENRPNQVASNNRGRGRGNQGNQARKGYSCWDRGKLARKSEHVTNAGSKSSNRFGTIDGGVTDTQGNSKTQRFHSTKFVALRSAGLAVSYGKKSTSLTQGKVSSISIGGSISFEGFLSSILLVVVIIVTVVIDVVILLVVIFAIVEVVIVDVSGDNTFVRSIFNSVQVVRLACSIPIGVPVRLLALAMAMKSPRNMRMDGPEENREGILEIFKDYSTLFELGAMDIYMLIERQYPLSAKEKALAITTLKDELRKLKGKALVDNNVSNHPSDPELHQVNVEPITPKLLNKRTAHSAYIKHSQEEAAVLRDLVDHIKANYPLDPLLESALKQSTSASGSQPSGNTKKDKIQQTQSRILKNKVEAHPRKVKSSLKNKDHVVEPKGTAPVQHSKLNVNSDLKCVKCNGCMLSDNHDLCVLDFINNVNARAKSRSVKKNSKRKVWKPTRKVFTNIGYIWRPTGRTFTIVGNACPLTRITTTTEVPLRKSSALDNKTPKPVVTLVYSRKPRKSKTSVHVNNYKVIKYVTANNRNQSNPGIYSFQMFLPSSLMKCIVQIILWYLDSGCSKHMTGDRSQLTNFVSKFLGTVKFGNDHVAKIMGYGDYQIGNVTISRVYYVEGLGHNLFSVG